MIPEFPVYFAIKFANNDVETVSTENVEDFLSWIKKEQVRLKGRKAKSIELQIEQSRMVFDNFDFIGDVVKRLEKLKSFK